MSLRTKFCPMGGVKKISANEDNAIVILDGVMNDSGVLNLSSGIYHIEIVGGGSGAAYSTSRLTGDESPCAYGGGSGSAFVGDIYLDNGLYQYMSNVYNYSAGAQGANLGISGRTLGFVSASSGTLSRFFKYTSQSTSSYLNLITAYAGEPSSISIDRTGETEFQAGAGGAAPFIDESVRVISSLINSAGNDGNTSGYGGASLYNGYGKGGTVTLLRSEEPAAGYIKLVYLGAQNQGGEVEDREELETIGDRIISGYYHTLYLNKYGDLYRTGDNSAGQQGNGTTDTVQTFEKIAQDVVQVAASDDMATTWYLTKDGDLYGCGKNDKGQQGSGDQVDVLEFTKRAENVAYVSASSFTTFYIDKNGRLFSTGDKTYGQMGDASYGSGFIYLTFTETGLIADRGNIAYVKATNTTTWYLTKSGVLCGCGQNNYGQIGLGVSATTPIARFQQVATNVAKVSATVSSTFYVTKDAKLYGTGYNRYGQQGSGTSSSTVPVREFTQRAINAADVISTSSSTIYLSKSGEVWGCGNNGYGQMGNGTTSNVLTFSKIAQGAQKIFASANTTFYLDSNNVLYGCGDSTYGQLNTGNTTAANSVFREIADNIEVAGCSPFTTFYEGNNGVLFGCGRSNYYQQGNGSTENVLTFEDKTQYLTN